MGSLVGNVQNNMKPVQNAQVSSCTYDSVYCIPFHNIIQIRIKDYNTIEERRSKINRNSVFDCQCFRLPLSPHWRQMAIENTVSIDFDPRSSIVEYVFDCRLPGVEGVMPVWKGDGKIFK